MATVELTNRNFAGVVNEVAELDMDEVHRQARQEKSDQIQS